MVAFFLGNESEEFKIRGGSVPSSHCTVPTARREKSCNQKQYTTPFRLKTSNIMPYSAIKM
jgi:hypothetical protein